MKTLKSVSVVLLVLGLVGCANMKSYSMPLTPLEELSMTPALVSAAQAACMELDVLTTLEWRLAPNFVRKEDD